MINPARIGTSEAGRRIIDAGIAFQARLAAEAMRKIAPLPEPEPPPTARTKLFRAPIEEIIKRPPTCREIINEVAEEDGVSAFDIVSARRMKALIAPRQKAMYRCRMRTPLSLPQIGKAFNRDHTTILHGISAHCARTGDPFPLGMKWHGKVARR